MRPRPRKRASRKTLLYKVGPGDTLIGIARQFAMDVDDVAKDNRIDENDKLQNGAILRLRVKPSVLGSLDVGVVEGNGVKIDDSQKQKTDAARSDDAPDSRPKIAAKRNQKNAQATRVRK